MGMGLKKDKQKEPKGFEKGFKIKAMQIWAFRNGPRVMATLKKKKKNKQRPMTHSSHIGNVIEKKNRWVTTNSKLWPSS